MIRQCLAVLAALAPCPGEAFGISPSRGTSHVVSAPRLDSFRRAPPIRRTRTHRRCAPVVCGTDPEGDDDEPDAISRMLDAPIIDPYSESDDEPSWLRSYKKLVREDYDTAEAIWAGVVVVVFLFFAQAMVRAYKQLL